MVGRTVTEAAWRRILKTQDMRRLPELDPFDEAPDLVLVGVRPIRNEAGDLVGIQHLIRDPDHPDGYRLDLRPGDYEGAVWIDGDGRAHPVE